MFSVHLHSHSVLQFLNLWYVDLIFDFVQNIESNKAMCMDKILNILNQDNEDGYNDDNVIYMTYVLLYFRSSDGSLKV